VTVTVTGAGAGGTAVAADLTLDAGMAYDEGDMSALSHQQSWANSLGLLM
jgi:hypothetical protein